MNRKNSNDIDLFAKLVSRFGDRLFRFAFMRIGNRVVAEDMVQEVFIRLYQAIQSGSEISDYERYLLHSLSNACIDCLRKKKLSTVPLEEVNEVSEKEDADIEEEFRRVGRLLKNLPFEQAETVRLKCYDNLTFRQIAELQGIPEATVKSRYRYAIDRIRQSLNSQTDL